MISPRARFQASPFAKGWTTIIDSQQFNTAAETALLEMQLERRTSPDLATSAAYQKEREGAMRFLEILMSLAFTTKPAPQRPDYNLDHKK